MTNPSLETFKAFLQDEAIKEKYGITDDYIAKASLIGKPDDPMIVVLIREMVNKHFAKQSPRVIANHLNVILSNRL